MSSQTFLRLLRSRAPQIRSVTQSPFLQAKPSRKPPPPPPKFNAKSIPSRSVRVQQPVQSAEQQTKSSIQHYARGLLKGHDSMLLYKAPKSLGLFITCAVAGSGLVYWAASLSHGVFMVFTGHWIAKMVILSGCMIGAGMATTVMLTPFNLVKTISLVRTAGDQVVFRVKGSRFLPFRTTTVDVEPGHAMIDANVTSSLDLTRAWFDIPLKNSEAWTKGQLERPDGGSLVNAWPNAKSYVRKMFNRDSMAYMRVKNLNWKLDLESCEMLEHGTILNKMVRQGAVRTNIINMMTRGMWGTS